ncbi:MAG: RsiV family protein [Butyrivibrio sp.]|nr:RsiV family protein [Butyrivibrio sp.]
MRNKNFILAISAIMCMNIALSGCGEKASFKSSSTVSSDVASNEESKDQNASEEDYPYFFLGSEDGDYSYIVDESGKCVKTIDRAEVFDILSSKFEVGEDKHSIDIEYSYGDIVFCSVYNSTNDWKKRDYYAVNTKTKDSVLFCEVEGNYYYDIDYYKGSIYITGRDLEKKFEFSDSLEFSESEVDLKDFFEGAKDYAIQLSLISEKGSYTRVFDEIGFVPAFNDEYNDEVLFTITKDGEVTKVPYEYQQSNALFGYDKDGFIIYSYDEDHNFIKAELVDPKTGEAKEFCSDSYVYCKGFDNNYIYYIDEVYTDTYMMDETYYYSYDVKNGEEKLLYKKERTPGSGYNSSYQDGYYINDGKIYFTDVDGSQGKWLIIDASSGDIHPTDCVYDEYSALKYGTVEYEAPKYDCPNCGKTLMRTYQEYFVLSDEYSDHADEINQSIKENIIRYDVDKIFGDYDEDDCSWRGDYYSDVTDTYEQMTWNVDIIKDHYLTVDESYYSMGVGAAHGYGAGYMLVYDLDTGKKMGISDFFDGTEEEFKKLMAEKTVEYFNSTEGEERNSHDDIGDDESIYHNAYEQAGFDTTHLEFYEDHVTLVYYQYEIAYYAAGCFYIDIPYEDFHA